MWSVMSGEQTDETAERTLMCMVAEWRARDGGKGRRARRRVGRRAGEEYEGVDCHLLLSFCGCTGDEMGGEW